MKTLLKLTTALAVASLFAACNQTTQQTSTPPTAAETQAIGDSISDSAASSAATLTLESGLQTLSLSSGLNAQAGRACITINPSPIVDTDGDGVPDNATYTFNCTLDKPQFAYSTTGTLQVSDPVGALWGFDSTSNLTHTVTNKSTGVTVTEVLTGTRSPRKTGDQVTQSHNITLTRTVGTEPTATITNLWNLTFNATTPGSIAMGAPLPAGSINLAGNYSFNKAGVNRSFAVATFTPLQYDPSCTDPLKIVGGKLRAFLNGANANSYLEITFGACGTQPSTKGFFTTAP